MEFRPLAGLLIALSASLVIGCGPTRTAGTIGLPSKDLAVLSISPLPPDLYFHIPSVQFDGQGAWYEIKNSRDFYLTTGDHTGSFTFAAKASGIAGWFTPANTTSGLKDVPLGAVAAGKAYDLAIPTVESADKIRQMGAMPLAREKAR
jgi:hypothetical protein